MAIFFRSTREFHSVVKYFHRDEEIYSLFTDESLISSNVKFISVGKFWEVFLKFADRKNDLFVRSD